MYLCYMRHRRCACVLFFQYRKILKRGYAVNEIFHVNCQIAIRATSDINMERAPPRTLGLVLVFEKKIPLYLNATTMLITLYYMR